MPPLPDDMTDLDRPLTRRDFREDLDAVLKALPTKEDLKAFATKEDLKAFATKEDLKAFATKEDLKPFATKEDLKAFATKEDLAALAAHQDRKFATKEDLREVRDELRRHFDMSVESFKSEFGNLFDFVRATTDSLGTRVDRLDVDHGRRLLSLEGRVTHLEKRRK